MIETITIQCANGETLTLEADRVGRAYTIQGMLLVGHKARPTINGLRVGTIIIRGDMPAGECSTTLAVHPGGCDPTPEMLAEVRRLQGDMPAAEFWAPVKR